jgi:hypothetical protein
MVMKKPKVTFSTVSMKTISSIQFRLKPYLVLKARLMRGILGERGVVVPGMIVDAIRCRLAVDAGAFNLLGLALLRHIGI